MEINGIPEGKLVIQPAALGKLINNYTKEAGVRSLERSIGRICRKLHVLSWKRVRIR